eukprot:ANDGO_05930.mRNA.1 Phospholipase D beta 1
MFRLEVTRIECFDTSKGAPGFGDMDSLERNQDTSPSMPSASFEVFLDMSCEGEIPQKFFVGLLSPNSSVALQSCTLEYFAFRPVTFTLFRGAYTRVSSHTISDFLLGYDIGEFRKEIVFSSRRYSNLIFKLFVRIMPAVTEWSMSVVQVSRTRGTGLEAFGLQYFRGSPSTDPLKTSVAKTGRIATRSDCDVAFGSYTSSDVSSQHVSHHGSVMGMGACTLVWTAQRSWGRQRIVGISKFRLEYEDGRLFFLFDSEEGVQVSVPGEWSTSVRIGEYIVELRVEFLRPKVQNMPLLSAEGGWQGVSTIPSRETSIKVLIDGLQTFRAYYSALRRATRSIDITAWEMSLSFGLVRRKPHNYVGFHTTPLWITVSDVLLDRALHGVDVRVIVWRHNMVSWLSRWLYLGEVTIERECSKLQDRATALGIHCRIFNSINDEVPESALHCATARSVGSISIMIDGNPHGVVSCHHEKLVLIDADVEGSETSTAFMGGFDMTKGRFDQPAHQLPVSYFATHVIGAGEPQRKRYGDAAVQPIFKHIRMLWHDVQIQLRGAGAVAFLRLHFEQRWYFSCARDVYKTRHFHLARKDLVEKAATLAAVPSPNPLIQERPPEIVPECEIEDIEDPAEDPASLPWFRPTSVEISRGWPPVIDSRSLVDAFSRIIGSAKKSLYVEHQYPFHNEALTHQLCSQLAMNPDLHVTVVMPVVSDLPTGLLGSWIDMSQDDVHSNLRLVHAAAPDRVGVFGIVSSAFEQMMHLTDPTYRMKPIYVHSKVVIADDDAVLIGSANMDNMSLFRASELAVMLVDREFAHHIRMRLWREHLSPLSVPEELDSGLRLFRQMAEENLHRLHVLHGRMARPQDIPLYGRVVPLVPADTFRIVRNLVSPRSSRLWISGLLPPSPAITATISRSATTSESGFFLQSML